MKNVAWVVGQIIAVFGLIYGLFVAGVISSELAVAVGLLLVVFTFSLDEVKKEVGEVRREMRQELHPLRNAVAEIQKWLREHAGFIPLHEIKPVGYLIENSPIKITPLGEELLEKSGAKKIVDEHYSEFERKIEEQEHLTAYDVQSQASRIIAGIEREKIMKPIKDFAYQNTKFNETPLTLTDVQRVMVIYLRDLYLLTFPN